MIQKGWALRCSYREERFCLRSSLQVSKRLGITRPRLPLFPIHLSRCGTLRPRKRAVVQWIREMRAVCLLLVADRIRKKEDDE